MRGLFAHETWFDHGVYTSDWGFAAESLTLALLAAAVLAAVLVRVIARFRPGVEVPFLGRLTLRRLLTPATAEAAA